MIINPTEFLTYIYPFAEIQADIADQVYIVVGYNGNVVWDGARWTPESWSDFMAKMNAAMSKAFEIQRAKS